MGKKQARYGLKYALLGMLIGRRDYGYALLVRSQTMLGEANLISTGLVYKALSTLENEHLIRAVGPRPGGTERSPGLLYEATDEGVAVFLEWLNEEHFPPVRWDLTAKVALVLPEHIPTLLERVDAAEDVCMTLIRSLSDRVAQVPDDPWRAPLVRLAYKYGLTQLNARVEWLRECRFVLIALAAKHEESKLREVEM